MQYSRETDSKDLLQSVIFPVLLQDTEGVILGLDKYPRPVFFVQWKPLGKEGRNHANFTQK